MSFRRQRIEDERIPEVVRAKWSSPTLAEGFVPLPKRLLRVMHRLFKGPDAIQDLRAVLAVVDYRRPNLRQGPSLEYLSFLAGLDPQEFRASLDRLTEAGLIEVQGDDEELNIGLEGLLRAIEDEVSE